MKLEDTKGECMMNKDEKYMKEAIKQAKKAYTLGEVPIGCVIVYEDKIIGRGYNRRTIDKNTIAHAEMMAIKRRVRKWTTGGLRIVQCMLHWSRVRCVRGPLYSPE